MSAKIAFLVCSPLPRNPAADAAIIYIYIYIYIYMYSLSLSLSLYIYIYIYVGISLPLSLSIYIYIYMYMSFADGRVPQTENRILQNYTIHENIIKIWFRIDFKWIPPTARRPYRFERARLRPVRSRYIYIYIHIYVYIYMYLCICISKN